MPNRPVVLAAIDHWHFEPRRDGAAERTVRAAIGSGRPFLDLLAEDKEIARHMDRAALSKLCDPANYLGLAGEMVE